MIQQFFFLLCHPSHVFSEIDPKGGFKKIAIFMEASFHYWENNEKLWICFFFNGKFDFATTNILLSQSLHLENLVICFTGK